MRWIVALLLMIGVLGPALYSAPVDGVIAKQLEVPANGWTATMRFRGGERASVQIAPLQGTKGSIEITVHDAKGNKIAEDKGRPDSPDFAAVFWYPPRDGEYRITITSTRADTFYVAIR
jgi:hypothetical protein